MAATSESGIAFLKMCEEVILRSRLMFWRSVLVIGGVAGLLLTPVIAAQFKRLWIWSGVEPDFSTGCAITLGIILALLCLGFIVAAFNIDHDDVRKS